MYTEGLDPETPEFRGIPGETDVKLKDDTPIRCKPYSLR